MLRLIGHWQVSRASLEAQVSIAWSAVRAIESDEIK